MFSLFFYSLLLNLFLPPSPFTSLPFILSLPPLSISPLFPSLFSLFFPPPSLPPSLPPSPREDQYMAFGLSGRRDMTFMVGADATVAWVNTQTGQANAVDYYLTGRDQVNHMHRVGSNFQRTVNSVYPGHPGGPNSCLFVEYNTGWSDLHTCVASTAI